MEILQLAVVSTTLKWYVIVAHSSGGGWMNDQSTPSFSSSSEQVDMFEFCNDTSLCRRQTTSCFPTCL